MPLSPNFGQAASITVPPDSNGKRTVALRHVHVEYGSGSVQMFVGDTIVGNTSGSEGEISEMAVGNSVSSGVMVVVYSKDNYTSGFIDGEQLVLNGSLVATVVVGTQDYYTQGTSLIGANNPHNSQFVDYKGSAYTRFSEGEQQLDAFGLSRFTTPTLIGQYTFQYSEHGHFTDQILGGAVLSHVPNESSFRALVGTADADSLIRTTDTYHLYQHGFSQNILMTVTSSDAGTAGVRRRWGYFDEQNGLFFQLDGTTLSVVLRSYTSGVTIDTVVDQVDWNNDKADGASNLNNLSRFDLDASKDNVYWMDFQWLGAGRVRFGVITSEGERITLHSFENANNNTGPYMTTASLPLRTEITNTTAQGSSHDMKVTCMTVMTEGNLVPDRKKRTVKRAFEASRTGGSAITTTETPIFSIRASQFLDSVVNRKLVIPEIMSIYVKDNPVAIRLYKNTVLTAASFTKPATDSAAEVDVSATLVDTSGSVKMITSFHEVGTYNEQMPPNFGVQGENIHLRADGTADDIFTFTAECLTPAATADLQFSLSWIDVA